MGAVINLITRPIERRHMELFGQYASQPPTTPRTSRIASFRSLDVVSAISAFQTGGYQDQPVLLTGPFTWQPTGGGVNYQVG